VFGNVEELTRYAFARVNPKVEISDRRDADHCSTSWSVPGDGVGVTLVSFMITIDPATSAATSAIRLAALQNHLVEKQVCSIRPDRSVPHRCRRTCTALGPVRPAKVDCRRRDPGPRDEVLRTSDA
jgi:hypothetical protein